MFTNKFVQFHVCYAFKKLDERALYPLSEERGFTAHFDKQIDQAQKEAEAKGRKIDNCYIKQIKKDFHRQDKKYRHRAVWFAQCAELEIPYSSLEADLNFDMHYMMTKSAKSHNKDIDVPIPIMVGVTVSLCGLFLVFVPLPVCQTTGFWLMNTGVGILSGEAIQKWDQYDRE